VNAPRLFPRRGITLLQAQRWAGSLAALFAYLACAVSGELGPALVVLFPVALLGAHFFGERAYGKMEWAWTLFLAVALVVLGAEVAAKRLDVVLGVARFTLLLCVHRIWHRRTQRDELLFLLLCLLLLCAGAALSAELLFGFAFLAFAVAGTWALALTHLRFEIEAGRGPQGSAVLLQSRRIATPSLLGALAALAMMGLMGSAVIFLTFPRVNIGLLRRPSRGTPTAGLSDRVDLSRHGTIADDPRVVLRVRLEPPPHAGLSNLGTHWRARALEVWTGQGWAAAGGAPLPVTRPPPRPKLVGLAGPPQSATIDAVAGFLEGVLVTPEGWPLSVEFRRQLSARGAPQRLLANAAGDLFYSPVEIGDLSYQVWSERNDPGASLLRGRGQEYPASVDIDLEVPADLDPRVRELSRRLTAGKDPADAADAIESYLSSNLKYTRDLPGEQADPIAHFLFERRMGHCELFSSAMVILLRAGGIPARNVTGYYGGVRTDAGYYAVRAGDAHSWVEVFIPGAGFVPFDPTPAGERGSQQEGLWARMVLFWDTIQERWRAFVVDYDLIAQAQLVNQVGAMLSEAGRRLSGKGGSAPQLRIALRALGLLLLAALLALAIRRAARSRPGARQTFLRPDQKRAIQLWRTARTRLQQAGLEIHPGTTPTEAARHDPAAGQLVSAYLAARWGNALLPPEKARHLLSTLNRALESKPATRT
jgi:transglutaminase-like putative cysteine protease